METDTLVVGASAAGLAVGAGLARVGQRFELVEARDVLAGTWRGHYDRLHLHTPRGSSALPGLAMPRSWGRYPSRDQVVEYLEQYRDRYGLRPHFGRPVIRIERDGQGWCSSTPAGQWRSRNVVIATGLTRVPVLPSWPGMADYRGTVLHSGEFRTGRAWRDRTVIVVGFGNSACEQALDLVEHGARVHLSVRSPVNVLPRDVFGIVPVLQVGIVLRRLPPWLADALARPLVRLTVGDVRTVGLRRQRYGPLTQIARDRRIPLLDIGTMAQLRAGRITVHPGPERFVPDGVEFTDGSRVQADLVLLGTGYRPGLAEFLPDWRAVCAPDGTPLRSGAPAALPGLYLCGMSVSPAGMLREIGIEAGRIAADIAARRPAPTPA